MKLGNIVLIALGGVVVYLWAKNRKKTGFVDNMPIVTPAATATKEPWWRLGKYKQEQIINYVLSKIGKTDDLISWAPGTPASVINENYITMGVNRGILVPSFESEMAFMAWLKGENVKNNILSNIVVNRPPSQAFTENKELILAADTNTPLIVNNTTGQPSASSMGKPATML
jgi:hypothetical protein